MLFGFWGCFDCGGDSGILRRPGVDGMNLEGRISVEEVGYELLDEFREWIVVDVNAVFASCKLSTSPTEVPGFRFKRYGA